MTVGAPVTPSSAGRAAALDRAADAAPAHGDALDRARYRASPSPAGLLVYRATGGVDAIDEYCRRLAAALRRGGSDVVYTPNGWPAMGGRAAAPAWILLQYNPFRWGPLGFAPGLVRDALRLRHTGVPLAIMVHEAWVDVEDARTALIGGWQRVQLRALLRTADLVLTSTEALARELGGPTRHVPIAATVTPGSISGADARNELGLQDGLIVTVFGRANPARALDYAERAIGALALADDRVPLTVLNLGADAPPLDLPSHVDVRQPGRLDPAVLSRWLSAGDLVLLPFTDGLSTRRTTLMAALAHGRPVVGLHGPRTDTVLLEHPEALVLTPVGDPEAYARAVVALAPDRERLRAVGEAGRRLYADRFDWPVIARTIGDALDTLLPGPIAATGSPA